MHEQVQVGLSVVTSVCRVVEAAGDHLTPGGCGLSHQGPQREPRHSEVPPEAGSGGQPVCVRCGLRPHHGDCHAPPRLLCAAALY